MPKKILRQMLLSQILSTLTVSACLLIDNCIISRFLGTRAVAAYGFASPVLLAVAAISSILSAGATVACSRSLGTGAMEETNVGFSTAMSVGTGISLVITLIIILASGLITRLIGVKPSEEELFAYTREYLIGFVIGAPGTMIALIMVPFLQMAGQNKLLILSVLGMTVADIAFDLLNVYVFKGGTFGMGLASSLSYYVALAISLPYFFTKKCAFRFSFRLVRGSKLLEMLRNGIPTAFNMLSGVAFAFIFNRILKSSDGGSFAVAAFAIINGLGGAFNSVSTGMGNVALTLSGVLYSEEDRNGLRCLLHTLMRYAVVLGIGACVLAELLAPALVSLFSGANTAPQTAQWAVDGLRIFALGFIPCCVINALKGYYQGSGRVTLNELISVVECAVLPAMCAVLLSNLTGMSGVWFYFLAAELLTLGWLCLKAWLAVRNRSDKKEIFLLLRENFGVAPENVMEADIRTIGDAAGVAEAAQRFCLEHGGSTLFAGHIALCVEEMAANTITYGFPAKRKNNLSVLIQKRKDVWVLRFRDDCLAFDPVSYVPPEGSDKGLGIRLVTKMADEVRYTYSMSLNNLTLRLREK